MVGCKKNQTKIVKHREIFNDQEILNEDYRIFHY